MDKASVSHWLDKGTDISLISLAASAETMSQSTEREVKVLLIADSPY